MRLYLHFWWEVQDFHLILIKLGDIFDNITRNKQKINKLEQQHFTLHFNVYIMPFVAFS